MKIRTYKPTFVLLSLCVCGLSQAKESQKLTIKGQVVDYMARPVEGAEVVVYEEVRRNSKHVAKVITSIARTDQEGHFEICEEINSRNYTHIVARKQGLAMAWDRVNRYGITKGKGRVVLMLDRPGTLSGIVVDHNGRPVSGAKVQAVPKTTYISRFSQDPIVGPGQWFSTQTNSQGIFRFESFSPDVNSDFWIKASTSNCTYAFTTHSQNSCGFEVEKPNIRLVLPREARAQGRVVEAETGRPIEGVTLAIQDHRQRGNIHNRYRTCTVTSGKDGRFLCQGLPEGKSRIKLATLELQKGQWAAKPAIVDIRSDSPNDDIQVTVEKSGIIELSVREEETNRPLSDFFVRAWSENDFYILGLNPSGMTRLCVLPGEYEVNFWHKKPYSLWRADNPIIVEAGKTSRVPVVMETVPAVSGRIIHPSGESAVGVMVTVSPYGNQVYTDGNGVFQAEGGSDGCDVIAQDFEKGLVSALHVKEVSKPVELRLKPGLTVVGEITDSNGIGIPAARVCFHGQKISPEVLTDREGRFKIKAIPSIQPSFDYRVSVYASGFAPKTRRRISFDGEPGETVEIKPIQLESANMSISGIVVDANDVPAPGVILFLSGTDGVEQPDKSTATDEKGRFAFKRICKGPIRLQVNFSSSPAGSGNLRAEAGDQDLRAVLGQDIVHLRYKSLKDKPLPELKDLGIKLSPDDLGDKMILVCFFDMNQRPSRACITQLAKQAQQLKQQGIVVVAVQASKIDENALNQWVKNYNIPFSVGMVESEAEKTRFTWGVKSLPWLILTGREHIVRAEDFRLSELDEKINDINQK